MNLKFNKKNYKSNLVEFSDERVAFLKASNEAEEMKYIKIIFLIIILIFFLL